MRHRIGMGKPLGMGSCRICVEEIRFLPSAQDRFHSLGVSVWSDVVAGPALDEWLMEWTRRFREDRNLTMEHLRRMMVWDENDQRTFRYPEYTWFKAPGGASGSKPLKPI